MKAPLPDGQEACERCGMMLRSSMTQWHKCKGSDMGCRPANISIDTWVNRKRTFELKETKVEVPEVPEMGPLDDAILTKPIEDLIDTVRKERRRSFAPEWAFLLLCVVAIGSVVGSVIYQISQESKDSTYD